MTEHANSSKDLKDNPTLVLQASQYGPVIITKQNQPAYVLMNMEEYRRLQGTPHTLAGALAMPGGADVEFDPPKLDFKLHDPELD